MDAKKISPKTLCQTLGVSKNETFVITKKYNGQEHTMSEWKKLLEGKISNPHFQKQSEEKTVEKLVTKKGNKVKEEPAKSEVPDESN